MVYKTIFLTLAQVTSGEEAQNTPKADGKVGAPGGIRGKYALEFLSPVDSLCQKEHTSRTQEAKLLISLI